MSEYQDEDLKTEELDGYLSQTAYSAPRRILGTELTERLRTLLAPPTDQRPQPENHPARCLVLWRIARSIARIAGYTAEDETLDSTISSLGPEARAPGHVPSPHDHPDPWFVGLAPKLTSTQQNLLRTSTAGVILSVFSRGRVPLLPPPLSEDTDALDRWFEVASILTIDLNLHRTEIGQSGLDGMEDPRYCPYHQVTPHQILTLEELLVDEAQRLIIKKGERPAVDTFRKRYGFTRAEALNLMRLARAEALRMDGSSVDENRAIMSAQLKDYIARTKESLNQKDELSALKELGRVQGLTRTEPEDQAVEFFNTIARVAARQDEQALKQLPERIVDVKSTPVTEDDDPDEDPDALRRFDEENRRQ